MVVRKDKKVKKYRGSKTHGGGSMKKRRGAGNRGGRGNAGSGKKAQAKYPTRWKSGNKLGKYGFKKKGNVIGRSSISLKGIELKLNKFLAGGIAKKENDVYVVDLRDHYDKLVGTGKIDKAYKIIIAQASQKAIEKVKDKGGEVVDALEKPENKEKDN
jgi:large subunit ribosomal protein L15